MTTETPNAETSAAPRHGATGWAADLLLRCKRAAMGFALRDVPPPPGLRPAHPAWHAPFAAQGLAPDARLLRCDVRRPGVRPGARIRDYGNDRSGRIEYRFNSAGYRSEELDPRAALRILVVGESYAAAVGLAFRDGVAQRFKDHLAEATGIARDSINCINLGIAGAGADTCSRALLRQIDIVRPHLVLCILPPPFRTENYAKGYPETFNGNRLDVDRLDDMPDELVGFVQLYNKLYGHMSLARNALLLQMACRLRGIEHLIASESLTPRHFRLPVMQTFFGQLDHRRILCHDLLTLKADRAADGSHAGARTHNVLAVAMLETHARALAADGHRDTARRLLAYSARFRNTSADWAHLRAAREARKAAPPAPARPRPVLPQIA